MSARPRILFVDDEPAILSGLQNLLYKDRKRWDMTFLPSGDAAAAEISRVAFDVVVTDMRMPGLDGAALLGLIRDAHPSAARIMLSGHADGDAILRSLPVVHQLLSKPCAAEVLREAIRRGLALTAIEPATAAAIGRLDMLPSSPEAVEELHATLESRTTSSLVGIFERDASLAVKALQLVNFHYFGSGAQSCSIADAVAQLGPERVRHLAAGRTTLADPTAARRLVELQAAAYLAARLARREAPLERRDEVFATRLLRDVGEIALLAVGATGDPREVGASLLDLWGLPRRLVDAVRQPT